MDGRGSKTAQKRKCAEVVVAVKEEVLRMAPLENFVHFAGFAKMQKALGIIEKDLETITFLESSETSPENHCEHAIENVNFFKNNFWEALEPTLEEPNEAKDPRLLVASASRNRERLLHPLSAFLRVSCVICRRGHPD